MKFTDMDVGSRSEVEQQRHYVMQRGRTDVSFQIAADLQSVLN